MKLETIQSIARALFNAEMQRDDNFENGYTVGGYYLSEIEKPATNRKMWEIGMEVYDAGTRDDPPSSDYVVIGEANSLGSALRFAAEYQAKTDIALAFRAAYETESLDDDLILPDREDLRGDIKFLDGGLETV